MSQRPYQRVSKEFKPGPVRLVEGSDRAVTEGACEREISRVNEYIEILKKAARYFAE